MFYPPEAIRTDYNKTTRRALKVISTYIASSKKADAHGYLYIISGRNIDKMNPFGVVVILQWTSLK